jgi:predicted ATPase
MIVSNLDLNAISNIVAQLLAISTKKGKPLAASILIKSSGNLFLVLEYIWRLVTDGLLEFDAGGKQWTWDQDNVRRTLDLTSVNSLLTSKMKEVPQQLQELLKVASCIGSSLDENILSRAMSAPVSSYLKIGRQRKLLVADRTTTYYTFSNGHIQDAFYGLIDEEKRPEFHLAIGRRLLKNFSESELHRHIFVVLNQFRRGQTLIASQNERYTMAGLRLLAGKKAVKASSFSLAAEYFLAGIDSLSPSCWKDQYDLTLDLHCSSAEALYVLPDFDAMGVMIRAILVHARSFDDQLRARYVRVLSLSAQDRAYDAIKDGLFVLSKLGERFPKNLSLGIKLLLEYRSIRRHLRGMTDEMILRLPNMASKTKTNAMQMLNLLFFSAYSVRSKYYPFILMRMVSISLAHGLCEISAFAFAIFGTMVCGVSGDIELGCRYGDLSLKILKKSDYRNAREWVPRVNFVAYGLLGPWKKTNARVLATLA